MLKPTAEEEAAYCQQVVEAMSVLPDNTMYPKLITLIAQLRRDAAKNRHWPQVETSVCRHELARVMYPHLMDNWKLQSNEEQDRLRPVWWSLTTYLESGWDTRGDWRELTQWTSVLELQRLDARTWDHDPEEEQPGVPLRVPRIGDVYELTLDTLLPDLWFENPKDVRRPFGISQGEYVTGIRFRVSFPEVRTARILRDRIADGSLRLVTAWDSLGVIDEDR